MSGMFNVKKTINKNLFRLINAFRSKCLLQVIP